MMEAIAPVAAHGAPRALKRGAKTVAGSRSAMKDRPPKRLHDLLLAPVWMLAPQSSSLQSAHRLDETERDLRPALERHLAKSFDLLGMKAAFDKHIGILFAFLFRRELDSEFAQLMLVDVAWRPRHEIEHAIGFRERDHFADAFFAGDHHHDPIQPERDATMRRRAETKGAEDVAEEQFLLFFAYAERGEDFRLQIAFVNSNTAAAEFHSVQDNVVSFGADPTELARFQLGNIFRFGAGERMMNRVPFL